MKKLLLIVLFAFASNVSAQVEGVWEEFLEHQGKYHFLGNVEVMEINGTFLLLGKKKTHTFRKRLDGKVVTDLDSHGEFYSFDENNELHANDADGRLDPDYVKLNKIK